MDWLPKKKVLVPVDFSPSSLRAVSEALRMVDAPAHLAVLHVAADTVPGDPGLPWNAHEDDDLRARIRAKLQQQLTSACDDGVQLHVAFGNPGIEIARFAEAEQIELIVMPSHGHSSLERMLVGSVTERVVRMAPCSVLVLRI